jgi:hypothetical protein
LSQAVVGTYDKLSSATKGTLKNASKEANVPNEKAHGFSELTKLLAAFPDDARRIIVFSLPHGNTVDQVLTEIGPNLKKGDVILDGGNEWWESTERRQKKAWDEWGVHFIGMGVSGGCEFLGVFQSRIHQATFRSVCAPRSIHLSRRHQGGLRLGGGVLEKVGRQNVGWHALRGSHRSWRKWAL